MGFEHGPRAAGYVREQLHQKRSGAIGVEARTTEGIARVTEVVGALPVDNDYEEREVAAVLTYLPSPALRLAGRLGHTEREYEQLPQRNFDGGTGRLDAEWLPGNKTALGLTVYRAPRSIVDIGASHVLVDGVSFGPRWAPTAKLVFGARILREEREYQGEPAAALGLVPVREEVLRALRFTAGWEPYRHHQVSAAYENGERDSNRAGFRETASVAADPLRIRERTPLHFPRRPSDRNQSMVRAPWNGLPSKPYSLFPIPYLLNHVGEGAFH